MWFESDSRLTTIESMAFSSSSLPWTLTITAGSFLGITHRREMRIYRNFKNWWNQNQYWEIRAYANWKCRYWSGQTYSGSSTVKNISFNAAELNVIASKATEIASVRLILKRQV
jgi:hypothetical protein